MKSRRQFIGALGALGAAQLTGCASSGTGQRGGGALIDTHFHFYAPA